MPWAKISDTFIDDAALLSCSRGARLLSVEATVWSVKQLTDGLVPAHVLRRITDEPDIDQAVQELIDAGVWARTEDGNLRLLDWQQRSADEVRRAQAKTAERQARHRQHSAGDHSLCQPRYCRQAQPSTVTDVVSNGVTNDVSHAYLSLPGLPVLPERQGQQAKAPGTTGRSAPACPAHQHFKDKCSDCRRGRDELLANIEASRATEACEHGHPGGRELHPLSGRPMCPVCRRSGDHVKAASA